jgi:hypothetical protein
VVLESARLTVGRLDDDDPVPAEGEVSRGDAVFEGERRRFRLANEARRRGAFSEAAEVRHGPR